MTIFHRLKLIIMIFCLGGTCLAAYQAISPVWAENEEEDLFFVAQKAFEDGFYDVATRYIDQYLQKFPQTSRRVQAQLLQGQCYFFQSQYLKAFDIFQNLLQFQEMQDATLFWLGETYFKGSDYKKAKEHYEKVISQYPDSIYLPQAMYSLAWTYFEQSDYEQAKALYQKLINQFPAHQLAEDALFKIGECEHNLGQYETAAEYFTKYILKYPQSTRHAQAYFYIAESSYYREDYLTAVTYYAKAADIAYDPKITVMANISLGWSYLKLEKFDLSEKYFLKAEEMAQAKDLLSDDIYLGKATLYSGQGKYDEALAAYSKLMEQFPNSPRVPEAHLGRAHAHYALKNFSDAVTDYQWIIDHAQSAGSPETLEKAQFGLAWTLLKSGDATKAIQYFENIMKTTSNKTVKVSALTQIGDAYQDINQLDKAIVTYDQILHDYPESVYTDYVQFRQGVALLKSEKLEPATLSLQTLVANFPNSKYVKDTEYYLSVAYFKKEDWLQAMTHAQTYLQKASAQETFVTEAEYILGQSQFYLKDYTAAMVTFQKIIDSTPPQNAMIRVARLNIAKCSYQLGQTEEALKQFNFLIANDPDSEAAQEALLWLGDHYLDKGEYAEAIQYYQHFTERFPGSEKVQVVHYELGQAYEALKQFDQALNHYKMIDQSADKTVYAKARLAIADIFSRETDNNQALETYKQIAESCPDFKRNALVKMAQIHEQSHEYTQMIENFERALKTPQGLSEHSDAELQFNIADTYEILNETEKAIETYLKIPYLYKNESAWVIKSYLRIARIYEDRQEWDKAKTVYDKIIVLNTDESKYARERVDWIKQHQL